MSSTLEAENIAPVDTGFSIPKIVFGDVCDGCGRTPSYVAYNEEKGKIFMFCSHHSLKYADKLTSEGFKFKPELDKIY